MFIRTWLTELPVRPLLLIGGLTLWTLVLVTGRPAVIMDLLMTPATRAQTRTRRAIALIGMAVSIVVGLIIFAITFEGRIHPSMN